MIKEHRVGYTCQSIDAIIKSLKEISKNMETIDIDGTNKEDLQNYLSEWSQELFLIQRDSMEEIREDNSNLRSYAREIYKLALEQENIINELEQKIDN